jgi:hypothetical protein
MALNFFYDPDNLVPKTREVIVVLNIPAPLYLTDSLARLSPKTRGGIARVEATALYKSLKRHRSRGAHDHNVIDHVVMNALRGQQRNFDHNGRLSFADTRSDKGKNYGSDARMGDLLELSTITIIGKDNLRKTGAVQRSRLVEDAIAEGCHDLIEARCSRCNDITGDGVGTDGAKPILSKQPEYRCLARTYGTGDSDHSGC